MGTLHITKTKLQNTYYIDMIYTDIMVKIYE